MKYKTAKEGGTIIPKVAAWATKHNVGFPYEMKKINLTAEGHLSILVKYAPRPIFRTYHVHLFMNFEDVLVEYWLYKYEKKLREPLWIQIVGSYAVQPIMRNYSRRKIRRAIHAAMAEKGWAPDGTIAEVQTGQDGTVEKPPAFELTGSILVQIMDTISVLDSDPAKCLELGREIVRCVEAKQSMNAGQR